MSPTFSETDFGSTCFKLIVQGDGVPKQSNSNL